jgi:hypothetical protein
MFPQEVYQLDQQYYRNKCALSEKEKDLYVGRNKIWDCLKIC